MSQQVSSLLILLGGVLLSLVLWVLSILAVHWDTNRRKLSATQRKAWLFLSILLPLLGSAIYLALHIYQMYLVPPAREGVSGDEARLTAVKPMHAPDHPPVWNWPPDVPEPAWGKIPPKRSNGNQSLHFQNPPSTLIAAQRPLRVGYGLAVLKGPHQGQQFILDHLPARIGRGQEVAIPLDDDLNVSRGHAEIYEWNGRLRIRDLQSSHGTWINDRSAADQTISPGDRITVGKTVLLVREIE